MSIVEHYKITAYKILDSPTIISDVVAEGMGENPKFWAVGKMSENFPLVEIFRPKMQNLDFRKN